MFWLSESTFWTFQKKFWLSEEASDTKHDEVHSDEMTDIKVVNSVGSGMR
jgi:hypothetical protein